MDLSRSKFILPGINTASYRKRVGNPILGCDYPHTPDQITSWMGSSQVPTSEKASVNKLHKRRKLSCIAEVILCLISLWFSW